jgi:hypothetical protein
MTKNRIAPLTIASTIAISATVMLTLRSWSIAGHHNPRYKPMLSAIGASQRSR